MVVARKDAFDGAPETPRIVLASTTCRTVRCQFVLRSPYAHELEVLGGSLERLIHEERPVWQSFGTEPISAPEGQPSGEHYLRVTVAFNADDTDSRALAIAAAPKDPTPPKPGGDPPT